MPIKSNALTTLARLKVYLGITSASYDTVLEYAIDSATAFILQYCDRTFQKIVYSNEIYDGNGSKNLLLKNYPVISGQTFTLEIRDSIDNNGSFSVIASEDYFIKESSGIISYISGIFAKIDQHYRISYTAGYDYDTASKTLTSVNLGDLEYAVWKLCATIYYQRTSSGNVSSEHIGDYSITYMKEVMTDSELIMILDRYKRPYQH